MFKSFASKFFLCLLIAFMMSACATVGQVAQAPVELYQRYTKQVAFVAPEEPVLADVQIELPALDMPVIEVEEREVPTRLAIRITEREVRCMTDVIYHEARSESETGQRGVAHVVLNRIADGRFPNTICNVVYDRKHGCQFSWTCTGKPPRVRDPQLYATSEAIARDVLAGKGRNPIGRNLA